MLSMIISFAFQGLVVFLDLLEIDDSKLEEVALGLEQCGVVCSCNTQTDQPLKFIYAVAYACALGHHMLGWYSQQTDKKSILIKESVTLFVQIRNNIMPFFARTSVILKI